jgi:hypothetical protein
VVGEQFARALGAARAGTADETDFAANGILGADFPIPMVPQLTAGVRYRLLFVNTGSSGGGFSNDDFIGHVFTANATYHF